MQLGSEQLHHLCRPDSNIRSLWADFVFLQREFLKQSIVAVDGVAAIANSSVDGARVQIGTGGHINMRLWHLVSSLKEKGTTCKTYLIHYSMYTS